MDHDWILDWRGKKNLQKTFGHCWRNLKRSSFLNDIMKLLIIFLVYSGLWIMWEKVLILRRHLLQFLRMGNSLAVPWLGLDVFTAEGSGSIPGRGTKIPQATQHGQKKKKKKKNLRTKCHGICKLLSNDSARKSVYI